MPAELADSGWAGQDQILAWEMAALPADSDPTGGLLDGPDPRWDEVAADDPFGDYLDDLELPEPDCTDRPLDQDAPPGDIAAAFGQDGTADRMAPGTVLAGLAAHAWRDGLTGLDDNQLTGLLQAADRLHSWCAALRVAAVSEFAGRRETTAQQTGDWRSFEHVSDEIAIALTLTAWSANRILGLALALDRLPLTRAALAA